MIGEERELYRSVAARIEEAYKDRPERMVIVTAGARAQVVTLRTMFPEESDDSLARMARLSVIVLQQLGTTPAISLSDEIEGTLASFVLATAALSGVRDLGEEKTPEPEPKPPAPKLSEKWGGPYL